MAFQTPILCDRRIYDKKGSWRNPQQDIHENIYYFIKENLTFVPSYVNGREELKKTITITVFGSKPICVKDKIKLNNGEMYEVQTITPNYIEQNVIITDLLKPRIGSLDIVLG